MLKKLLVLTVLLSLVLVGMFSPTATPEAFAQDSGNLLQNPGFEGDFVQQSDFVEVGEGWQPWNLPPPPGAADNINAQPEYRPAPETRVLSGDQAQQYDTFWDTHDGGIYQVVTLSTPATVTFTANIYPYSSETFEDLAVSEDPQEMTVRVGIDPNGGEDGGSPNIIWSAPVEYYDEYRELSVSTTTTGTTVSVWVRSTINGDPPGLHQVFIDDTALTIAGGEEPTEEPTEAPTETPTEAPTEAPTEEPTEAPTEEPTETPTEAPTETPTEEPTEAPTEMPTEPVEDPGTDGPTAVAPTPFSDELPNIQEYVVEEGDTVFSIAQQFNSTAEAIIAFNNLNEDGFIRQGQTLEVPVPENLGRPVVPPDVTPPPGGGGGEGGGMGELPPPGGIYIVQPGDNLFRIALRYGLTTQALANFNGIINPNRIQVGQEIRIPPTGTMPNPGAMPPTAVPINPGVGAAPAPVQPVGNFIIHVVQPGENAFRIGLQYNVTWDVIAAANGLINPNRIHIGQQLIIPR
jgi:LysM repeat protein